MWCWDITWLPGPIRGQFYFLYLIIDLYSRKIVGWEVHEVESSVHARDLVERTVWREGILDQPLVLHGDNGSPLKGSTVQALLSRLGITASFRRPRVSDEAAYAEALFRILKYSPGFPRQKAVGFKPRGLVASFACCSHQGSYRRAKPEERSRHPCVRAHFCPFCLLHPVISGKAGNCVMCWQKSSKIVR